jgi:hypothetical protein
MGLLTFSIEQIGKWLDRQGRRQQRSDAAVKAILLALNETQAYIADWRAEQRSRERELFLVRLWTDAAVAIRSKDRAFAEQLQMKAEYWTDPMQWTDADVRRAGIRIKSVAGRARALLGGAI